MTNFYEIASNVDVLPLLLEVHKQPELWNKNPARLSKRGPHWDCQDIFLRGEDETSFIHGNKSWVEHGREHIPVWYKTIDFLPSAKKLILNLSHKMQSEMIGGCYLYKVSPGHKIFPHIDRGWHPDYFDKFNICLQSNEKSAFVYDDNRLIQKKGDIHFFRNDVNHSVINEGECDHIVMIVCLRIDRGYRCPWSPENWTIDKQLGE